MTIDELIQELQKIKDERGNIEVCIANTEFDCYDPITCVSLDKYNRVCID